MLETIPERVGQAEAKPLAPGLERHYTIAQISDALILSPDAVRRVFLKEPGVLILGDNNPGRRKRRYFTLRIPESVYLRVKRKMSRVQQC